MATEAAVVDASVAVKWYLPDETDAAAALRLRSSIARGALEAVAPLHLRYEVPSAIAVARRRSRITIDDAQARLGAFLEVPFTLVHDDDLVRAAFDAVQTFGCAFYDGLYVALALRLMLPFVTADRKLYELVAAAPGAVWIADWEEPTG